LGELIKKYELKNPATGVEPLPPVAFNLMFQTPIGPSGNLAGYLRPETAQGQFLNFAKLLDFNQQQMPFASASIGKSYRNEISPRSGLIRVREFLMAEIEHFVDPHGGKKHKRFEEVKDVELVLLNKHTQLAGETHVHKVPIGQAVANGTVDNETLGYFLARIHLFLEKIGVDQTKIRFRQHMANEMAHYAADCWDAELLTSYGWIECVGCADRSAYDLSVHAKKTGAPLFVRERLETPITIEEWQIEPDKKKFGPHFKKDGKAIEAALEALSQDKREVLAQDLKLDGKITIDVEGVGNGKVEVSKDLIVIERRTRTENTREYTPNVIEPSFGIGRILYSLMEHVYWTRGSDGGDEARGVSHSLLHLKPPLTLSRSSHSLLQSHLQKSCLFLSHLMRASSLSSNTCLSSSVPLVSRAELMTLQPPSVNAIAEMTSWVLHLVSRSTSRVSRTRRTLFEIVILQSKFVQMRIRSWLQSSLWLRMRRSGPISRRNYLLLKVKTPKYLFANLLYFMRLIWFLEGMRNRALLRDVLDVLGVSKAILVLFCRNCSM
jgi:glycyl-tRNA synthetase